jgi:hypothetical protein
MDIISTARIRLAELFQDSINFIEASYNDVGKHFTMASPMGQLLQVTLSLGRMILYYVEDSITELNINTATRTASIRGLAALTGHNPSRGMGARGTLRLTYNGEKLNLYGNTVSIPNHMTLVSSRNGLPYTIVLPGNEVRLNLTSINNYLDVNVIQGKIEYQQATGTGDPLQSFNFQSKKGSSIDNYYVNVFINGKRWAVKDSILDMVYRENACIVRTGQTGGIDIFFGNGFNGAVPPVGATILVEYLLTDGDQGNLNTPSNPSAKNWKFSESGYALNSEEVDLNKVINVGIQNDIIFGSFEEPVYLTRLIAPRTSRSYVLANTDNYITFLRKLNVFSIIDAIPGFATFEDRYALDKYNQAKTNFENVDEEYRKLLATIGASSELSKAKKIQWDNANQQVYFWQEAIEREKQDDNTVYLYLVPDVNKRISAAQNYYTCPLSSFILSSNEKTAILNLIEESGQRVITVDNAILTLKYPRFVLNTALIIYEGFEYDDIRESVISKTSDYFLKNTRRDRIPTSDIVRILEGIEGIDSVTVWFDAARSNFDIYQDGTYGLDAYGDIILQRYVDDAFGNKVPVKDVYPLIRGGFESYRGIEYDDSTDKNKLSTVNIQVRGITPVDLNSQNNSVVLTNV